VKAGIKQKAAAVTTLILDVDGVLTDGSLYYSAEGEAMKRFSVRDGSAIKWLQRAGVEVAIITGRLSAQTEARAKELEISTVIQNAIIKLPVFESFLEEKGIDPATIAYIGDDLHDIPVMKRVGLSMAPADCDPEVAKIADLVLEAEGGHGAVREAAELILKSSGKWDDVTSRYRE